MQTDGRASGTGAIAAIRGVIPACVTPFNAAGEVDLEVLARLIDWQIGAGVDGIFVTGTGGEFWALSPDEKACIYRCAVETAGGRVPVLAGTCDNTTAGAADLARRAEAAGVDGVTVLNPFAVKLSQEELAAHFRAIAAAVHVKVVLYNNPKLTGVTIAPKTVAHLAAECPTICAIKDSSADIGSVRSFVEAVPKTFSVLNGYDADLLSALGVGAAGGVSGSANALPSICAEIYDAYTNGDLGRASAAQERFTMFRAAWTLGTPPSVIKAGAELAGIPVGPPRPPVRPLGDAGRATLADVMRRAGVDVKA